MFLFCNLPVYHLIFYLCVKGEARVKGHSQGCIFFIQNVTNFSPTTQFSKLNFFLPWLHFAAPGRSIGIDFDCIIHALLKWRYPCGDSAFIGFHCVGCSAWQRASAQRPQTDPTHTRVNTDIWLCAPLASLLKRTSPEYNELTTEVMFTHTHSSSQRSEE